MLRLCPPSFGEKGKGNGSAAVRSSAGDDDGDDGDGDDDSDLYLDDRSYYSTVQDCKIFDCRNPIHSIVKKTIDTAYASNVLQYPSVWYTIATRTNTKNFFKKTCSLVPRQHRYGLF